MNDIAATQRRTLAYWFTDGIPEMVGGAAMVVFGGLLLLATRTGLEWLALSSLGLLLVVGPISAMAVKSLKERVTHPRTGYVAYPAASAKSRGVAFVTAFATAGLLMVATRFSRGGIEPGVVATTGAAVAGAMAVRAYKMGLKRFYVIAVTALGAGMAASFYQGTMTGGVAMVILATGAVAIVTGAWTFAAYLRANRPPEGGA